MTMNKDVSSHEDICVRIRCRCSVELEVTCEVSQVSV